MTVNFQTIKLLDYRHRMTELADSNNPFASVLWASLQALLKGKQQPFILKKQIARRLMSKGFSKQNALYLLNFLDYLLQLPEKQEKEYYQTITEFDEEQQTMYIPSYWREQAEQVAAEALQRGKAEGKHDGEIAVFLATLKTKFGEVPPRVVDKIWQADEQQLLR